MSQPDLSDLNLASFDDMLADQQAAGKILQDSQVCSMHSSMCFAMEGIMTTLFTPPGCDWSEDGSVLLDNESTEEVSPPKESQPNEVDARKVCSMWKKKRRAEKQKLMRLRSEGSLDHELQSEAKLAALTVQRSFERKFNEADDTARYEKYGNRPDITRDNQLY